MAKIFKTIAALSLAALMGTQVAFAADTSFPSDVESVEALPDEGAVSLSWDPATDDTAVTGYKIYSGLSSVQTDGGSYTFGDKDVGNVVSYKMTGLSNNVTYYFVVTAYDAAGNESEYYSNEVEATPTSASDADTTSPTVSKAEAISSTMVEVNFSEAVVLPENGADAFSVESTDGTALLILDAYNSSDDAKVVFLITDEQTAGSQYILTAGISLSDEAGNTIVSGTSDTGIFTGSSLKDTDEEPVDEKPVDEEPVSSDEFTISSVESTTDYEIKVKFSEAPVAGTDAITIQLADDASEEIEIENVVASASDPKTLIITTGRMDPGFEYVLSIGDELTNEAGDSLSNDDRETHFVAKTLDLIDIVAPEDVTEFVASILTSTSLRLTWEDSVDSAGDLAEYLVYMSSDGGKTFGAALEVASTVTSYDFTKLTAGSTYTFKVSAVDSNGNESDGVMTNITLPESGPELLVLVPMSMLGAAIVRRIQKKD